MDSQLKVFQSLNCPQCKLPFTKNLPNGPRKFPICGLTICTQCFEDIKTQRQQQQPRNQRHSCADLLDQLRADQHEACGFDEAKPAYFLIELINNPSIVQSPNGNGYYLTKQFDIPECVICQEEYSLETEDRKPCYLTCNHTICVGCVRKTGRLKSILFYCTICPICAMASDVLLLYAPCRTNLLIEFLKELPEMTEQLEMIEGQKGIQQLESRKVDRIDTGETATTFSPAIEITDRFDCPECEGEFPIEHMFACLDCSKKICGICVTRRHREHKLTDLFVEETRRISEETKQMALVQTNGYKKIFPELHQELIEKIASCEEALGGKAEKIAKLENLEKTKNEFDECKDYGDRFERISEDYLPNLRSFNTNLQHLIDELKEGKISETKTETEKK